MSGHDPWTPHYGKPLVLGPEYHGEIRDRFNEALTVQAEGLDLAPFVVEPVDRETFRALTLRETPIGARRVLLGYSKPSQFRSAPRAFVFVVAELHSVDQYEQATAALLRMLDEGLAGMVCEPRARGRRLRQQLERQRQRLILDVQREISRVQRLDHGTHVIAENTPLFVVALALPYDPATGTLLELSA